MRFSTQIFTLVLSLSATSLGAPVTKRALTVQSFNEFSVSAGVAGKALAEVNANFPIDTNNLAGVSASDLAIISSAAKISEQAEVATGGFNDALKAVSGDAAVALQNGKIKNKVLKLQTDVLRLQIQQAQGKAGLEEQIATQQKKLTTNVALDEKAAGQTSTGINFDGTD
ncbi:Nn.00g003420.m01.CDS01 [Neocucurbitaria sp. VM-36]